MPASLLVYRCMVISPGDVLEARDAIEETIRRLHPCEVPEILAIPVLDGGADYLAWLDKELDQPQGGTP